MSKYFAILLVFINYVKAQPVDTLKIENDSVRMNDNATIVRRNEIVNAELLNAFYSKIYNQMRLKKGKTNIVHIGDSHIQADVMTGKIRKILQQNFGNAGRGLVFPHRLANTNGSRDVIFSSNASWQSYRNIYPVSTSQVGLSGIALSTQKSNFSIELQIKEDFFNTIKIITPNNENSIGFAREKITTTHEIQVPKKVLHRVKRGETLFEIANTYNLTVSDIKKINRISNNRIQMGKLLKIHSNTMQTKSVTKQEFVPLQMNTNSFYHYYESDMPMNEIYLIPNESHDNYNLNGIILENDQTGILYHNIGVNGAKYIDYNKYPMFFEQLKSLAPDLVVVSLGTNESFGKMSTDAYLSQMLAFIKNVTLSAGNVPILVITPPPSLFNKKNLNTIVADYTIKLLELSAMKQFALWDLYMQMGGLYGVNRNFEAGLVTADKIHYTNLGYEKQGELFSEAVLSSYQNFLNR